MTAYFDFQPSASAPFQFQPTLDGQTYNAIVKWSLYGKRYYVQLDDLSGNNIFFLPLVGSPSGFVLQSLSWANQEAIATVNGGVTKEHVVGETVALTITSASPDGYNGAVDALIVDDNTFSYPLKTYPGATVYPGNASQLVNLAAGYFFQSTLVYRAANRQFEVNP